MGLPRVGLRVESTVVRCVVIGLDPNTRCDWCSQENDRMVRDHPSSSHIFRLSTAHPKVETALFYIPMHTFSPVLSSPEKAGGGGHASASWNLPQPSPLPEGEGTLRAGRFGRTYGDHGLKGRKVGSDGHAG